VTRDYVEDGRLHILQDKHIPDYVTVIRIHGPFLFGASENLSAISDHTEELTPVVILRLRNMTAIDATGLLALEDLADKLHATGRILILCGARMQPAKLMHQAEFEKHVGRENICPHIKGALDRANAVYEGSKSVGEPVACDGERRPVLPTGQMNASIYRPNEKLGN
jgi:SulP family sulfate permease